MHIGRLGVQTLEGWDAASSSLVEGRQIATFGITDDRIISVDQNQYDTGKARCSPRKRR